MKIPLIARPFYPAVSIREENPYQPAKPITDTDMLIIYAKSTQFIGDFLERLSTSNRHENNPPPKW